MPEQTTTARLDLLGAADRYARASRSEHGVLDAREDFKRAALRAEDAMVAAGEAAATARIVKLLRDMQERSQGIIGDHAYGAAADLIERDAGEGE